MTSGWSGWAWDQLGFTICTNKFMPLVAPFKATKKNLFFLVFTLCISLSPFAYINQFLVSDLIYANLFHWINYSSHNTQLLKGNYRNWIYFFYFCQLCTSAISYIHILNLACPISRPCFCYRTKKSQVIASVVMFFFLLPAKIADFSFFSMFGVVAVSRIFISSLPLEATDFNGIL